MSPRRLIQAPTAAACLALLASSASAQHAGFVLFGNPDAAYANQPKEQTFVMPATSPYFNESSFITTDARLWYAYQQFDDNTPLGGGHGQVAAAQFRLAITDRLQLVAYKDGYMWLDSDNLSESGWNDVGAGLKWNFYRDVPGQLHMALGAGYQFPWGDGNVLQNDAEVRMWFSIDKGFDKFHLGGVINALFTPTSDHTYGNSNRLYWDIHMDYYLCEYFSPIIEFNGCNSLQDRYASLPFQGGDLGNFGLGVSDPVVTVGFGGEVRPCSRFAIRTMWETQIDHQDDLFNWRLTCSIVLPF